MPPRRRLLAALALVALSACSPVRGPVEVVVLQYVPLTGGANQGLYEPRQVTLETPTNLLAVEGPVGRFLGGGLFDFDAEVSGTIDQVRARAIKDEGGSVHATFIVRDGVYYPSDFHSLNLMTTYYNLERARAFFDTIGLAPGELDNLPVYYFPTVTLGGAVIRDNSFWVQAFRGFFILPFDALQKIPLPMNIGVMGHEFSHAVFGLKVYKDEPLATVLSAWRTHPTNRGTTPGLNLLVSINEGIADVFGAGVTCFAELANCNEVYFGASLEEKDAVERSLKDPHCLAAGELDTLLEAKPDDYAYTYVVGSVLASALWSAGEDVQVVNQEGGAGPARKRMFEAVLTALGGGATRGIRELVDSTLADQSLFRLDSLGVTRGVLDTIVDAAKGTALKTALCRRFMERFGLFQTDIASCASLAAMNATQECPVQ